MTDEKDKVDFYRDDSGEWRWRRRNHGNHTVTGSSSEGYTTYRNCFANAFDQFGDTVAYDRVKYKDSGDPAEELEVHDD